MGFLKNIIGDLNAIFPESLKIYDNKSTGESAFEIVNKPNSIGVPLVSRSYENQKLGISMWDSTNDIGHNDFFNSIKNQIQKNKSKEIEVV